MNVGSFIKTDQNNEDKVEYRLLDFPSCCSLAFIHFFSSVKQKSLMTTLRNRKHEKGMKFVAYRMRSSGEKQSGYRDPLRN